MRKRTSSTLKKKRSRMKKQDGMTLCYAYEKKRYKVRVCKRNQWNNVGHGILPCFMPQS